MTEYTELEAVAASGDAAAIIESTEALTAVALAPDTFDPIPDLVRTVVPPGWTETLHDLEPYAETPRRKQADVRLDTPDSLARYVNEHRTAGTTLYADADPLRIVAVLNDHVPSRTELDAAGHRDHRATLRLERTPGCKRWYDAHGKYMDQETFAQMVEDGLTEIASPSGAELLELAQTMQSSMTATFRSALRLASGQVQFQYVEEGTTRAGATGDMVIPETITLVFQPFFGSGPMQVDARLRYRIAEGHLKLGVWLIRHVEALRAAFDSEVNRIVDLTSESGPNGEGVLTLYGAP